MIDLNVFWSSPRVLAISMYSLKITPKYAIEHISKIS
jgi:hypothetical protein